MAYQVMLVTLAALLQNTDVANFLGIKPNFVLIILLPLTFFIKDWRYYLMLVVIAGLLLSIVSVWDWSAAFFAALLAVAYVLKNFLPWQPFFNNLTLLIAITVAVSFPVFLPVEIILNVILGTMVYYLLKEDAKIKF